MSSLLIAIFLLLIPAQFLFAADDPIQTGKDALSRARYPWYDRQSDDARPLRMVPEQPAENRGDQWTTNQPLPTPPAPTQPMSLFGSVLQWLGITTLIVLLGFIAYLIASAFLQEEITEGTASRKVVETRRDADRVEALPFHLRAATGDFLAEARRLYEAGQYSQAIVYLFSYELVELDRHHVIRLAKGKTNRQYLRETRHRAALRAILELTMFAFEDAFFGHKVLTKEQFERPWQRLDEFQLELERVERAAA